MLVLYGSKVELFKTSLVHPKLRNANVASWYSTWLLVVLTWTNASTLTSCSTTIKSNEKSFACPYHCIKQHEKMRLGHVCHIMNVFSLSTAWSQEISQIRFSYKYVGENSVGAKGVRGIESLHKVQRRGASAQKEAALKPVKSWKTWKSWHATVIHSWKCKFSLKGACFEHSFPAACISNDSVLGISISAALWKLTIGCNRGHVTDYLKFVNHLLMYGPKQPLEGKLWSSIRQAQSLTISCAWAQRDLSSIDESLYTRLVF